MKSSQLSLSLTDLLQIHGRVLSAIVILCEKYDDTGDAVNPASKVLIQQINQEETDPRDIGDQDQGNNHHCHPGQRRLGDLLKAQTTQT